MSFRILHITSWFNKSDDNTDAVFIKNQIESLSPFCDNHVLHLTYESSFSKFVKPERSTPLTNTPFSFERYTLGVITNKWIEIEKRTFYFLKDYLAKNVGKYDIVNFYIAYPNAVKIAYFNKKYPDIKFTISEHWSAYRMNFNLREKSPGRKRIMQIFDHSNELFVVSEALGNDIRNFTGKQIPFSVVPNILENNLFFYCEKEPSEFFTIASVNFWSDMKNPFVLVDAVKILNDRGEKVKLILGGEGVKFDELKEYILKSNADGFVELTGTLSRSEVAAVLARSQAYAQSSVYETFSVICMEALATGTPVIAHNVGGMKEFVNTENGFLINDLEATSWAEGIAAVKVRYSLYDRKKIAHDISEKFSDRRIGKNYFEKLIEGCQKTTQE